jgi:virginiamycin B lyase
MPASGNAAMLLPKRMGIKVFMAAWTHFTGAFRVNRKPALAATLVVLVGACANGSAAQTAPSKSPVSKSPCAALQIPAPEVSMAARTETPVPGYALPAGAKPVGIAAVGSEIWATESGRGRVARLSANGTLTEYKLPDPRLGFNLAVGPDGRVWTAESYRSAVVGVAADGSVTECSLPKGVDVEGVAVDKDGTLWVTESAAGAVVRLRPGVGFEVFKMPRSGSQPTEFAPAADGFYVTEFAADSLAHVSAAGQITEIPLGTSGTKSIGAITTPDGAVWVAEFGADRLARVVGTTVDSIPLPAGSKPQSFVLAGNGRLLVTDSGGSRIDSVDISTKQVTTAATTGAWPDHITMAPDGSIWFTEYNNDRIARLP